MKTWEQQMALRVRQRYLAKRASRGVAALSLAVVLLFGATHTTRLFPTPTAAEDGAVLMTFVEAQVQGVLPTDLASDPASLVWEF